MVTSHTIIQIKFRCRWGVILPILGFSQINNIILCWEHSKQIIIKRVSALFCYSLLGIKRITEALGESHISKRYNISWLELGDIPMLHICAFAWASSILNAPFSPLAPFTCHKWVAYGTPKQTNHLFSFELMYSRKGNCIPLWCPSRRRKGCKHFCHTLQVCQYT